MRVEEYSPMGLRIPELGSIKLTRAERATLARAATILEAVRNLRNTRVPMDWYAGDDDDSDLLFGWRICDELSRTGTLDAESVA